MTQCRSVYQRLPWRIRSRILNLLSENAGEDEILEDEAVSSVLSEKGWSMDPADIQMIKTTPEYRQYMTKLKQDAESRTAETIAAAVLENVKALGKTADVARYELAHLVRKLIAETADDSGEEWSLPDRIKAVRALSQSLSALMMPAMERKIAARDAGIARLQSILALRDAEIRRLRELSDGGSEKVIEALNEKVGLGTGDEISALSEAVDPG